MELNIEVTNGCAIMILTNNLTDIMISGSIVNEIYDIVLSKYKIINMNKHIIHPDEDDLQMHDINDYKEECELKADIISNNTIIVRLYKKDLEYETEDNNIGFIIQIKVLFNIAREVLIQQNYEMDY